MRLDRPRAGFIDDVANGRIRWLRGPRAVGPLGNARRTFVEKLPVLAMRCLACGRLDLFAIDE